MARCFQYMDGLHIARQDLAGLDRPEETRTHSDLTSSFFPTFESDGGLIVGELRPLDAMSHTRYAMLVNRSDDEPATAYFDLPPGYASIVRLVATEECAMASEVLPGASDWSVALEPGEAALLRFDVD